MAAKQTDQLSDDFPKLASPARRALINANITRLDQLADLTESELSNLHGMGPNAVKSLKQALADRGLEFKPAAEFPHAIGNPAKNALHHIGITRLDQVAELTEKELLAIHGVGPRAVEVLRQTLADRGMGFKQ